MRDLGLQAAQTIIASKDPLRKLQDLAQNFPSHASWLSSLKVTEDFRGGAFSNLHSQVLGLGMHPSPGTLFINGVEHAVNRPIFNVFELLKGIRDEVRLLQRVDQLPVPSAAIKDVLQVR